MPELPAGTVTLLFTDIEGSTSLWERYPAAMRRALNRHHEILRSAVQEHGGIVFQIVGDAFCVAFTDAPQAVKAAIAAQRLLAAENWGEIGELRIRMGIHTGFAEVEAGEYLSNPTFNRVARVLSAGYGGQVLLSEQAATLARQRLLPEVHLRSLGRFTLRGFDQPEELFQLIAPGLRTNFPPIKIKEASRHNLPETLESFLGRQRELSELQKKLSSSEVRLVTIYGPGGMGKTRLAIEVAASLVDTFQDGCWFVSLAPHNNPEFIPSAILEALSVPASQYLGAQEHLLEYLRDKEMLLVLDNIEQLLPAAAHLCINLLQAAPAVKLLITSRLRLNLVTEWVFPLEGLDFPATQPKPEDEATPPLDLYAAPSLFLQQAYKVGGFHLPETEKPCVLQICRQVHGMPLALVLAASWTRLLSCSEIAEQIANSLEFLSADQFDLPERQRSIQAVFNYSWSILTQEQQAALRKLTVFRGGFDRQAAEQVAGVSLPLLAALLDQSMITRETVGRYTIHELLRQFCAARLDEAGETEHVRNQHLAYFGQLAEQAEPELVRADQRRWLDRLETELDNVRAALEWSLSSSDPKAAEDGLRVVVAMYRFWNVRNLWREARQWLHALLERTDKSACPELILRAWNAAAYLASLQGDIDSAKEIMDANLEACQTVKDPRLQAEIYYHGAIVAARLEDKEKEQLWMQEVIRLAGQAGDLCLLGNAYTSLGRSATESRDFPAAHRFFQEGLKCDEAAGHIHGTAMILWAIAELLGVEGDLVGAKETFQKAMPIFQQLNDKRGQVWAEIAFGSFEMEEGSSDLAASRYEKALAMAREIGEIYGELVASFCMTYLALSQGDLGNARRWARQSLERNHVFKQQYYASGSLILLASIAEKEESYPAVAQLLGMAESLYEIPIPDLVPLISQASSAAKEVLGPAEYARLYAEGQAAAEALKLDVLIETILDQYC